MISFDININILGFGKKDIKKLLKEYRLGQQPNSSSVYTLAELCIHEYFEFEGFVS